MKFMRPLLAALAGCIPTIALAQDNVPVDTAISALMFFTIGAALAVAIGGFVFFLRKRSNREGADRVLNRNHPSNRT